MNFKCRKVMVKCKKAVIIPGNGAGDVFYSNWYGWLNKKLNSIYEFTCMLRNMPDPIYARESQWITFMHDELLIDEHTLIIGHSSGACAAVRYAEKFKVYGVVLVSAYASDLGDSIEKQSGYFDRPWQWDMVKANTQWICQFGSIDDPYLPWSEQKLVAESLNAELHEYIDMGHFNQSTCIEIFEVIKKHLLSC
ncbi:serine hydrolase RBBP9 isoform X2 [Hydra vulgaris]|uniref:Serine hydrolase RBBP9 isoform X2 n=1 Tax=Hydra vulgaris TaxID=6087 RepID=A0ABM4BEN9_HYDVU